MASIFDAIAGKLRKRDPFFHEQVEVAEYADQDDGVTRATGDPPADTDIFAYMHLGVLVKCTWDVIKAVFSPAVIISSDGVEPSYPAQGQIWVDQSNR